MRYFALSLCLLGGIHFSDLSSTSSPAISPISLQSLPSLPLDEALDAYAAMTGLQMLYDASLTEGLRSSPVSNMLDRRAGLALLLRGTGLSARFTDAGAVVIYADTAATILNPITAVAAPTIGRSQPNAAALAYADQVQSDLVRLVREDENLSASNYKLSVTVWITPRGIIDRAHVRQGSGNPDTDASFLNLIVGTLLSSQPPSDLPQPLRVELTVRQRQ